MNLFNSGIIIFFCYLVYNNDMVESLFTVSIDVVVSCRSREFSKIALLRNGNEMFTGMEQHRAW